MNSDCSAKGFLKTLTSDLVYGKKVLNREVVVGEGQPGRPIEPSTLGYYIGAAIGGTLGAVAGILDVGD